MESIEEKLKKALNRAEPPDGLVARVMARVEAQPTVSKSFQKPGFPWLAWWKYLTAHPVPAVAMVVAIVVALGVSLGHGHVRRQALPSVSTQERIAGEEARDQMLLALKITGEKLSRMHELLSQSSPNGASRQQRSTPIQ